MGRRVESSRANSDAGGQHRTDRDHEMRARSQVNLSQHSGQGSL
jgi:hypothetical protein